MNNLEVQVDEGSTILDAAK
ncbi:MAG: hypothetical protein ACYDH3_08950, partial [Candidatus Aminicenantales bacterium]